MQSIFTQYHGPTNTRGSRIYARQSDGPAKITVSYDHALNADQNHVAAARALAKKIGWTGQMAYGSAGKGKGYVFVFTTETVTFDPARRARTPRRAPRTPRSRRAPARRRR